MLKNNLVITIMLLILFVGTSILALLTAKKITTVHRTSASNPDFFITDAIYTKFTQEGKVGTKIISPQVTHLALNNSYFFIYPEMSIYLPQEEPWQISAHHGSSKQGKSQIYLWDQVQIKRMAGINNPHYDITTAALTIYPDSKFAKTEHPITIVQDNITTRALGAQADFKTGIIKLMKKIEGIFRLD
jgi:LPS export ABC transporter protein LptC